VLVDATADAAAVAKANAYISGSATAVATPAPTAVTLPDGITPEVAALLAQLKAK
jgi:hypothetical protein